MKIHRFYVGGIHDKAGPLELDQKIWVNEEALFNQWVRVLRFRVGDQLVLFNDDEERLYKIANIEQPHSVRLELITEQTRKLPKKHVYLMWSLLKKDNNDLVLQKGTELGVRNFVPIIADRSVKTGFDPDRARKIMIEAAEQCGRADIPAIREPISIDEAINEYKDLPLLVCEQGEQKQSLSKLDKMGVLIGPEGGWSNRESELFKQNNLAFIDIADFTLRAETAAVVATTHVLNNLD
jgi:16S rRNA (uracil1498-N3)-methyltransferase